MIMALSHGSSCCRHALAVPVAMARLSSRKTLAIVALRPHKAHKAAPPLRGGTATRTGQEACCPRQPISCRCHRREATAAPRRPPGDGFRPASGPWARRVTFGGGLSRLPPTSAVTEWGPCGDTATGDPNQFCVVNFYHLVDLSQPEVEVERHKSFVEAAGLNLKGRVYLSTQGINAQYSGPRSDAMAYIEWLQEASRFETIRCHVWDVEGHQYPKLRIKFRRSLVQLAGGTEALPITEPTLRATPLSPPEWRRMLSEDTKPLVLDVRNNYEWDAGHFKGSARPTEENFCETPAAASDSDGEDADSESDKAPGEEDALPALLHGADPDAPVMMYCTGGIRCDIYSTYLHKKGFKNLYTLEGGIANYLRQEGTAEWDGSLFVFDDRLAIGPTTNGALKAATETEDGELLPAAVPCQLCGVAQAVLPHHNCANVMCNKLFIACPACRERYSTCCCTTCTKAPRLRFRLEDGTWEEKVQDGEEYFAEMCREGRPHREKRNRVVKTPVIME